MSLLLFDSTDDQVLVVDCFHVKRSGKAGRVDPEALAFQGPMPRGCAPPIVRPRANDLDGAGRFQGKRRAAARRGKFGIRASENKAAAFVFLVGMNPRVLKGF